MITWIEKLNLLTKNPRSLPNQSTFSMFSLASTEKMDSPEMMKRKISKKMNVAHNTDTPLANTIPTSARIPRMTSMTITAGDKAATSFDVSYLLPYYYII